MKCHLPVLYDVVAFLFLNEVPQCFGWRYRNKAESLHVIINQCIEGPFSIARTIPKFDDIGRVFIEEQPKILQCGNRLLLIRMNKRIKGAMG